MRFLALIAVVLLVPISAHAATFNYQLSLGSTPALGEYTTFNVEKLSGGKTAASVRQVCYGEFEVVLPGGTIVVEEREIYASAYGVIWGNPRSGKTGQSFLYVPLLATRCRAFVFDYRTSLSYPNETPISNTVEYQL